MKKVLISIVILILSLCVNAQTESGDKQPVLKETVEKRLDKLANEMRELSVTPKETIKKVTDVWSETRKAAIWTPALDNLAVKIGKKKGEALQKESWRVFDKLVKDLKKEEEIQAKFALSEIFNKWAEIKEESNSTEEEKQLKKEKSRIEMQILEKSIAKKLSAAPAVQEDNDAEGLLEDLGTYWEEYSNYNMLEDAINSWHGARKSKIWNKFLNQISAKLEKKAHDEAAQKKEAELAFDELTRNFNKEEIIKKELFKLLETWLVKQKETKKEIDQLLDSIAKKLNPKKEVSQNPTVRFGGDNTVVAGALDVSDVNYIVEEQLPKIRWCFEKAFNETPEITGDVVIKFVISAAGTVESAKVEKSTVKNSNVGQCLMDKIKKITFPTSQDGRNTVVNYPFIFSLSE